MAEKKNAAKKETFEDQLGRLETVVRALESGEKGLEDSLKLFEEGVGLARSLNESLAEVKRKVEVLAKDAEGKLKIKPMEGDEG